MDWGSIWQFGSVALTAVGLLSAVIWWTISGAVKNLKTTGTDYSHHLELRIKELETDNSHFKVQNAQFEARLIQAMELKSSLEKFGTELREVGTKLAIVADRMERSQGRTERSEEQHRS